MRRSFPRKGNFVRCRAPGASFHRGCWARARGAPRPPSPRPAPPRRGRNASVTVSIHARRNVMHPRCRERRDPAPLPPSPRGERAGVGRASTLLLSPATEDPRPRVRSRHGEPVEACHRSRRERIRKRDWMWHGYGIEMDERLLHAGGKRVAILDRVARVPLRAELDQSGIGSCD